MGKIHKSMQYNNKHDDIKADMTLCSGVSNGNLMTLKFLFFLPSLY